ncbi:porin family protein [Flavobacterium branchiophilum]|nr:porin family protein [Flavobacterium branchiophilum]
MKKIVLSLVGLAVMNIANAQSKKSSSNESLAYGVKAGLNMAYITGDYDGKAIAGANFGGFLTLNVADKFYVQPELLFSMQGVSYDQSLSIPGFTTVSYNTKIKTNFINIPVMARYFVADKFSLEAGPQLGILLSSKATADDTTKDIKSTTKGIDFTLNFGAGYDVTENIAIGARFGLGLTEFSKDNKDGSVSNNHRVFSINAAYKF